MNRDFGVYTHTVYNIYAHLGFENLLTLELEKQHPGVVLHEADALACSSPRGADRSEPDDVVVVAGHPCNGLQEFRQQLRPLGLPHSHRLYIY